MRRLGLLLVAAVLASATVASAGPGTSARAAANQKASRAKAPMKTFAPKAVLQPDPLKPPPVLAATLLTQYQRVGRALLLLANERRTQIGVETADAKLACAELQAAFRSIKIDDAVKTAESRAATAAVLADLNEKIERLRGVALTQDCLNNPLAKDCT